MSEQTREQRRTAFLREVFPLYETIDLTVDSVEDEVRASVPLSKVNSNHFGAMHAGVLFSLAEGAAGIALTVPRELRGLLALAKGVTIRYLKPATSAIQARASFSSEEAAAYAALRKSSPKAPITIAVQLFDDQERLVAEADATFVFRDVA